jgi:hypothetical protein
VIGIAAGVPQVKPLWDRRDLVSGHDDIFSVEAAFRVFPIVGIDVVADFQPPHPRSDGDDNARTVVAEH